jgi:RNA polymerase sigma-70 factor (ECF subfamily)
VPKAVLNEWFFQDFGISGQFFSFDGAEAALKALKNITDKRKVEIFYLYHSLLGEIYTRLNNLTKAKICFETAIQQTQSQVEKDYFKTN